LINYPSPMFMALPIKLSVTGVIFNGQIILAHENARRHMHVCIVDELDPYGPLGGSPNRTGPKPSPAGDRILPRIFVESEIGQADKHVLKNVTRVEKFVQEALRRALEDQLVFPNFYTFAMGE